MANNSLNAPSIVKGQVDTSTIRTVSFVGYLIQNVKNQLLTDKFDGQVEFYAIVRDIISIDSKERIEDFLYNKADDNFRSTGKLNHKKAMILCEVPGLYTYEYNHINNKNNELLKYTLERVSFEGEQSVYPKIGQIIVITYTNPSTFFEPKFLRLTNTSAEINQAKDKDSVKKYFDFLDKCKIYKLEKKTEDIGGSPIVKETIKPSESLSENADGKKGISEGHKTSTPAISNTSSKECKELSAEFEKNKTLGFTQIKELEGSLNKQIYTDVQFRDMTKEQLSTASKLEKDHLKFIFGFVISLYDLIKENEFLDSSDKLLVYVKRWKSKFKEDDTGGHNSWSAIDFNFVLTLGGSLYIMNLEILYLYVLKLIQSNNVYEGLIGIFFDDTTNKPYLHYEYSPTNKGKRFTKDKPTLTIEKAISSGKMKVDDLMVEFAKNKYKDTGGIIPDKIKELLP